MCADLNLFIGQSQPFGRPPTRRTNYFFGQRSSSECVATSVAEEVTGVLTCQLTDFTLQIMGFDEPYAFGVEISAIA